MTVIPNGDTVNYDQGPVKRTAEMVVAVGADGSTFTDLASRIGNTDDAAWNGSDADATVISLLKAIALNTTPAP